MASKVLHDLGLTLISLALSHRGLPAPYSLIMSFQQLRLTLALGFAVVSAWKAFDFRHHLATLTFPT